MSALLLTKHHGFGNDFLVVFHPAFDDPAAVARRVCDRRRGVGADGLLVGESEPGHSARMMLFNADGSRAEMSGNGIRCFAQALAMRRHDDLPVTMTIATDAGPRVVQVVSTDDTATVQVTVGMGRLVPIDPPAGWAGLSVLADRPVAHIGVGNPHSVVAVGDVTVVDLEQLGRRVPDVNLEIIEPGPEEYAVTMRVHERGAGLTEACGTGAVAAAWAADSWGLARRRDGELVVHMDGGSAIVSLDHPEQGHATLAGPATHIAAIEVP
ncbi:MAG: diaminopimelate epimerase [Ilumatobacteraceae bacterium]